MRLLNYATAATISMLVAASYSTQAQAVTFTEVDDAGESLGTAQVIPDSPSLLESISGILSGFDDPADLFRIFLTDGQSFSASTVGGSDFDTRLYLFDSQGLGVYFNDDASVDTMQSTLPANTAFTPTQPGFYYLGIALPEYAPVSAKGDSIFPSLSDFPIDVPIEDILTGVYGATGSGGSDPFNGFDGAILSDGGGYTVKLTGAQAAPSPSTSVPEPASALTLLVLGAAGAGLELRKKSQAHANPSEINS
ncbi:MAG TPA: hypothetical protein V6D29_17050 [Leptolyngbyaceae cyanobacterium]